MTDKTMQAVTLEDGESANIVVQNIEQLKAIFPEIVAEGANGKPVINFDALRQLLGDQAVLEEGEEKYGLNWHGKKKARQIALTPSTGTLLPCLEESVDWEATKNIFIEGDNLEVLKLLQKSYAGKIKMIYIDPPYNTGKEFIYPDNYQDNLDTYLRYTNQKTEGGLKLTSNTESSGRKHTNWVNMLYPRLKLARSLLSKDGVIFISIDDNEQANLRKLCDEIFGEENFLSQIVVQSNKRGQTYKEIAKCHEYLFVYYKSDESLLGELEKKADALPYTDEFGGYDLWELRNRNPKFGKHNRPNLYFPIYVNPKSLTSEGLAEVSLERSAEFSEEVFPRNSDGDDSCWRWGRDKIKKDGLQKDRIVVWGRQKRDGGWNIYEKSRKSTTKAKSIWADNAVISEQGTVESGSFGLSGVLEFPKPLELIKRCVMLGTSDEDIVLDFFAGSGTTAHAVLTQNAEDGMNRRFILVQLPEPTYEESESGRIAKKNSPQAFDMGFHTIADVSKERIRRSAKLVAEASPNLSLDLGFKLFKLATSNIKIWSPDRSDLDGTLLSQQESVVSDRSELDLLYELLIKRGVDLAVPIDTRSVGDKKIFSIGYGVLFACLDSEIKRAHVEELAQGILSWREELKPQSETHVFFRDSAFTDDVSKTNMAAILEQNGINHVRSL